jgi:hypothetical protein
MLRMSSSITTAVRPVSTASAWRLWAIIARPARTAVPAARAAAWSVVDQLLGRAGQARQAGEHRQAQPAVVLGIQLLGRV